VSDAGGPNRRSRPRGAEGGPLGGAARRAREVRARPRSGEAESGERGRRRRRPRLAADAGRGRKGDPLGGTSRLREANGGVIGTTPLAAVGAVWLR